MKLPFPMIVVLLLLLGGPLSLMQYHSRAVFIEKSPYRPLRTSLRPQLTRSPAGTLISGLVPPRTIALHCSLGTVGDLSSYYELQREKWFARLYTPEDTLEHIPGLMNSTARAIVRGGSQWQPVVLPEQFAELRCREVCWAWRTRWEAFTREKEMVAGKEDLAAIQMLSSTIGRTIADRFRALMDSHLPNWLAERLKPAPVPGIHVVATNAIKKSGRKWRPALVALAEPVTEFGGDVFAAGKQGLELYAAWQTEMVALDRPFPHCVPNTSESGDFVSIASRTAWPTAAMVALGTITSDPGIVTTASLPHAVLDLISGGHRPTFRIGEFAKPGVWRPALFRAFANFGQICEDNR